MTVNHDFFSLRAFYTVSFTFFIYIVKLRQEKMYYLCKHFVKKFLYWQSMTRMTAERQVITTYTKT